MAWQLLKYLVFSVFWAMMSRITKFYLRQTFLVASFDLNSLNVSKNTYFVRVDPALFYLPYDFSILLRKDENKNLH